MAATLLFNVGRSMLRVYKPQILLSLILLAGAQTALGNGDGSPQGAVRGFFDALNLPTYTKDGLARTVTDDFIIFELGEAFDLNSFDELLDGAGAGYDSTEWVFSDVVVTESGDMAHLSYVNDGRFVEKSGNTIISQWLESALVVRVDDRWRVKFLQSDLVRRERQRPDGSVEVLYPRP